MLVFLYYDTPRPYPSSVSATAGQTLIPRIQASSGFAWRAGEADPRPSTNPEVQFVTHQGCSSSSQMFLKEFRSARGAYRMAWQGMGDDSDFSLL